MAHHLKLLRSFVCLGALVLALTSFAVKPEQDTFDYRSEIQLFTEIFSYVRAHYISPPPPESLMRLATEGLVRLAPVPITLPAPASIPRRTSSDELFTSEMLDELRLFTKSFSEIRRHPDSPSAERLMRAALEHMLGSLDRHSAYLDPDSARELKGLPPTVGAVGVTLQKQGKEVIILGAIDGSPAMTLDLRLNDRLLTVDDVSVRGKTLGEVTRLLRGPLKSQVRLTFERKGEVYTALARRSSVALNTVESALYPGSIGYVRISSFAQTTPEILQRHLNGLRLATFPLLRGVVIDLRHNTGGILNSAIAAADLFLDGGTILATTGRGDNNIRFSATSRDEDLGPPIPVVIVVNGQTASGAEAFAAALQDSGRAKVIGTSTYGLGSVQTIFPLNGGGMLKLTTSRLIRPSGGLLEQTGIIPDLCVQQGSVVFLERAQVRTFVEAQKSCPPDEARYEHERDDVTLKIAIDFIDGMKRLAAGDPLHPIM